jgi:hypothetical protein
VILAFLTPIFRSHRPIAKVQASSFSYCLGHYWQRYAARKPRLESVLEFHGCLLILDHDKVVVFTLEAGCREIGGAGPDNASVDL